MAMIRTLGSVMCAKCTNRSVVNKSVFSYKTGRAYATGPAYKHITTELVGSNKNIGLMRFNRPQACNSLSKPMFAEIAKSIANYDADNKIRAIIVTGNEKFFSSGGDIKEVHKRTYSEIHKLGFLNEWEDITKCRKPIIAAVNGFALGGGFEFAVSCDIIYASETAKFCLSEESIGTVCRGGGTQRLARSISKSNVMELILTANIIDAHTAEKMGIISRVCQENNLLEEGIKLAEKIGTYSPLAVQLAKEAVNQAFETTLKEGLELEKHLLHYLDAASALEKSYITSCTPVRPDH